MRVRELMNRKLVTISDTVSCREALARMHRARIRHLPVLRAARSLVGAITDRDLRHLLFMPAVCQANGTSSIDTLLEASSVREVMSAPAVTIQASEDIAEAARVMRRNKTGSLPVLEGEYLVGIITETDVLREICRADANCSPKVTDVVMS